MSENLELKVTASLDTSKLKSQLKNQQAKIDLKVDSTAISSQIQSAIKKATGNIKPIKIPVKVDMGKGINGSSAFKDLNTEFQKLMAIQKRINSTKLDVAKLDGAKNTNELAALSRQLNEFNNDYNVLMNSMKAKGFNLNENQWAKLQTAIDKTDLAIDRLKGKNLDKVNHAAEKAAQSLNKVVNPASIASEGLSFEKWCSDNSKAVKKYTKDVENLRQQLSTIKSPADFNKFQTDFRALKTTAIKQGNLGRTLGDEIGNAFTKFTGWFTISQVIMTGVQQVKNMATAVLDVDTAMTELRKVSTASDADLSGYFDRAAESAKKYGASVSDVINSTADWSRMGYKLEDADLLSQQTTLLQRVGDNMTQESSAEAIISTLKGFQMEAEDVNHIVDSINEVANTQPIDTRGISEALKRSSSSMAAAGNTLEETIGLITAANSVVQDPESVGEWLADIA